MEVEETPLPGIGLRHDLVVRAGQRLGVVSQVNGDRELVLYDREDPDACPRHASRAARRGACRACHPAVTPSSAPGPPLA